MQEFFYCLNIEHCGVVVGILSCNQRVAIGLALGQTTRHHEIWSKVGGLTN